MSPIERGIWRLGLNAVGVGANVVRVLSFDNESLSHNHDKGSGDAAIDSRDDSETRNANGAKTVVVRRKKICKAKKHSKEDLMEIAKEQFLKDSREKMEFVCRPCHRMLFRKSVQELILSKYDQKSPFVALALDVKKYPKGDDGKEYICKTCHRHLKKGKVPPESVANGLDVEEIPECMRDMNELEAHFVAQKIIFMKMVSLPKGKQKGLKGACVNIPCDMNKAADVFPRFAEDVRVVPFKLKRRVEYRGNYLSMKVDPQLIMNVMTWLCENNPHWEGVKLNSNWRMYAASDPVMNMLTGASANDEEDSGNADVEMKENGESDSDDDVTEAEREANERFEQEQNDAHENEKLNVPVMSTVITPEQVEAYEYNDVLAPGEGHEPMSFLDDPGIEVQAFPQLLPGGRFSWDLERHIVPVSKRRHADQQLLHVDGRFA